MGSSGTTVALSACFSVRLTSLNNLRTLRSPHNSALLQKLTVFLLIKTITSLLRDSEIIIVYTESAKGGEYIGNVDTSWH
jgi:hypothetical protein